MITVLLLGESTSTANIERLSKLQKRAARIILKTDFSVRSRINYNNKAFLTYKALNNTTPDYVTKMLLPMSQTHSLNLRSGQNGTLYTPLASTSLFGDRS